MWLGRTVALVVAVLLAGLLASAHAQDGLPGPAPRAQVPGQGTVSAVTGANIPFAVPASASATAIVADENYRLGAGDKMKITVYDEPDLTGEFLVDGSGEVQFPLIGQVHAAGLTVHEFVSSLAGTLAAKYLRDPKVNVEIKNYRPFYIIGEVNKPGEYPFESGLNALDAVALAGGYTYRANHSDVYIRRYGSSDEKAEGFTSETKIYPGDVVRIPERIF
jgi:protein involved in polysaccharide export with SLBB domain